MSTARLGGKKWADVDEDDDDDVAIDASNKSKGTRFESAVDSDGIKTVIEYTERDNKTYKITKRVRVKKITTRTTRAITDRKDLEKFGKAVINSEEAEKQLVVKSEEDVYIEISKKRLTQGTIQDEAIEKFYEDSVACNASLNKEKKTWASMNAERKRDDDVPIVTEAAALSTEGGGMSSQLSGVAAALGTAGRASSMYVPPSLRGADGKGKGKDIPGQEASLRITNLSEDCKEGDLQDLFGGCGRVQRVYIAKDQITGVSRGFAFVTYTNRADAEKAIKKLHGFGYDNLILQVQFAKPKQ